MITRTLRRGLFGFTILVLLAGTPAYATFHFARISELMTSYDSSSEVQFVEINMLAGGQNLVSGSKLNVFDAQGNFVETVLTVSSNVASGSQRKWIMGTPAFETVSGLQVDFEFANGKLPVGGGMVCWGKPGTTPTPVNCPVDGSPYVDCVAYGSYSGASNDCIGNPTSLLPDGHSLQRVADTRDNANDFACGDPADPTNNSNQSASLEATMACSGATTTTVPPTTTTLPTPTTTLPATTTTSPGTSTTSPVTTTTLPGALCGDGTGDSQITASDALVALRTAISLGTCAPSVCDVDDNGSITAADALRILQFAVGRPVELNCPAA